MLAHVLTVGCFDKPSKLMGHANRSGGDDITVYISALFECFSKVSAEISMTCLPLVESQIQGT